MFEFTLISLLALSLEIISADSFTLKFEEFLSISLPADIDVVGRRFAVEDGEKGFLDIST